MIIYDTIVKLVPTLLGGTVIFFIWNVYRHIKAQRANFVKEHIEFEESQIDEHTKDLTDDQLLDTVNKRFGAKPGDHP
jgi:hypothetical protein